MQSGHGEIQRYLYFLGLLLSGISFRVIGDVYVGEIILTLLSIDRLMFRKKNTFIKVWHNLKIAGIIWTLANLVGSIHSSKSFTVLLISVFTPILTISCLSTCLHYMNQSESVLVQSLMIFALGRFLGIMVDPLPYTDTYPWKFGYGENLILLFIVLSYYLGFMKRQFFGGMVLSAISIINQSRTLAFLIFVSVLALLTGPKRKKNLSILFIFGTFLPIVYWIYLNLGISGNLGVEEISRTKLLTSTNLGPLAARKEVIFSFRAFLESPIFGYGFNPNVKPDVIASGYQFWADHGYTINNYDSSTLPLHSFFWAAVIQGGILASSFWVLSFFFAVGKVFKITEYRLAIRVLVLYSAVAMVDRILFSPFGAYERLYVAIFMGILISTSVRNRTKEICNDE